MSTSRPTDETAPQDTDAPSLPSKEAQSGDLFEAAVLAKGLTIPDHLKTKKQRWLMLIIVALSGACAAGPVASWPTLEPILIREGVFEGPHQMDNLSGVFSIASGVGLGSALLSGMLFDLFGPRWCGVVGAFGGATSLVFMAFAVKVQSMNWLLWIFYPTCVYFGMLTTNGLYAWYWLLPENQNSVSSICGSLQVLSDSFCLLAVWFQKDFGFPMYAYFLLVAGVAGFAGMLAFWLTPTMDENNAHLAAVIEYRDELLAMSSESQTGENANITANADAATYGSLSDQGEEAGDANKLPSTEQTTVSSILAKVKDNLADTFAWVRLYPKVTILFSLYNFFNYMWCVYPQFNMLELYTALVGPKLAHSLVVVWGAIFPTAGVILVLSLGPFVDKFGYVETIGLLIFPAILNTCLYSTPDFYVQCFAQVLLAGLSNSWNVILPRFCLHYAPPELFGTIYGLQASVIGISQTIGTPLSTWVGKFVAQALHAKSMYKYSLVVVFWSILWVTSTLALLLYWRYNPLPEVGSCSIESVKDARFKDHEDCSDTIQKTKSKKDEDCEKGNLKA